MSNSLRGKFFQANRDIFGDNSVKYMNIDLALTSVNYDNSGYGFDWGNNEKGSKLLANAILTKISTPTVARVYADKYTESVLQKFTQDTWSLEAIEVAKWVNANTDYKIVLDEIDDSKKLQEENTRLKREKELEEKAKEERRVEREKEFQQKIKEKLEEREKQEELRRKEDQKHSINEINDYKERIKKYQNELEKQQSKIKEQQEQIEKYKEFVKLVDIPSLRKKFTTLDEIDI